MTKLALLACLLLGASCASRAPVAAPPTATPTATVLQTPTPAAHPDASRRIAVVLMENKEYGAVAGNRDAPYVNALARRYAAVTSYYAVSHPSLPNYLALVGGDTFGITSDCTSCHVNAANLADQLEQAHVSWKAYMEDMPHACFTGASSGRYAKKHDPFIYFDDLVSDPAKCNNVVPLSTIDYNALPSLVWITPNLCNDTHDCSVATGDRYLSKLVPNVLHGLGPHGVVFITYDEGSSGAHGGGHVFTVVAGPGVRPGRYSRTFDHYALLRTIEDAFGLPHLAHAAGAPSMASILS